MLKLATCKHMMATTIHKNNSSLNNVWVCYAQIQETVSVFIRVSI